MLGFDFFLEKTRFAKDVCRNGMEKNTQSLNVHLRYMR